MCILATFDSLASWPLRSVGWSICVIDVGKRFVFLVFSSLFVELRMAQETELVPEKAKVQKDPNPVFAKTELAWHPPGILPSPFLPRRWRPSPSRVVLHA